MRFNFRGSALKLLQSLHPCGPQRCDSGKDESLDVVISNSAFNLIPAKAKAPQEGFRFLKANGRLMIADQVLTGKLQKDAKKRVESWFK